MVTQPGWWTRRLGKLSAIHYVACSLILLSHSYATGWNYFFKYIIATPTNLTAAGLIIQYWKPDLNVAIWVCVFGVAVIMINVSLCDYLPR